MKTHLHVPAAICKMALHLFLFAFSLMLISCKSNQALKRQSYDNIEMLKRQVLLVRLNTAQNSIDALRNAGKTELANRKQQDIQAKNERLIAAFKKHFTFTKVLFFYSGDAEALKNRQFDQVQLFDANRQPATNTAFLKDGYLVAALGNIYHDQYVQQNDSTRHAVAGSQGRAALIVMDANYVNLGKPFPYRALLDPNKGLEEKTVVYLNRKFEKYQAKAARKRR